MWLIPGCVFPNCFGDGVALCSGFARSSGSLLHSQAFFRDFDCLNRSVAVEHVLWFGPVPTDVNLLAEVWTYAVDVRLLPIKPAIALLLLLGTSEFGLDKTLPGSAPATQSNAEGWADATLKSMSTEEKVGQLFMIRLRVGLVHENYEYARLLDQIHKYHVGALAMSAPRTGPAMHRDRRYETVTLLNRLQAKSKLPLLVAGDFEQGVLPAHLFGTTVFPHAMAFGAAGKAKYAEEFGRITALESRAIGVHWNLFPVADVNSNPANPIIGTRAFGADPKLVGELVAAYIRGAHANGLLTTAKHFPGHGNTATDSHLAMAEVDDDLKTISAIDLPPFRRAIEAGVDAVMTAHVRVPTLDPDPDRVATTSPKVVTDLLKKQLGFRGLVVADALDMAGVNRLYRTNPGRAAVDAFQAGNDVITMPANLDASYQAILHAVRAGEISQSRLDESVLKILTAKAGLGLAKNRFVDIAAIPGLVGVPQNVAIGQRISDDSVTLVRDNGKLLPLMRSQARVQPAGRGTLLVVFCDSIRAEDGRVLEREIRARQPEVKVLYVDPVVAYQRSSEVLKALDEARAVVAAVYIVPSAARSMKVGRNSKHPASLPDSTSALLNQMLATASAKMVVLAMGSPYLTNDFPAIQNYLCAFSNSSVSEVSAAKALFGEIAFHGHLPVRLADTGGSQLPNSAAHVVNTSSAR
jgi:beta-N-acetylhexosaminidase